MITIGIASFPSRSTLLKNTIESLYRQVDIIYVALNEYGRLPEWGSLYPNVFFTLTDNVMGDANKFMFVDKCEGYYLSCDDDIIYPPTYAQDMIEAVDKYDCIVSLTGKWYGSLPITNWRTDFSVRVHCLKDWEDNVIVHVGGTGVMAFHRDFFDIKFNDFKRRNMADIWVALAAYEQDLPIMALPHKADYLTYQKPTGQTIWQKNEDEQYITDLLNSFIK